MEFIKIGHHFPSIWPAKNPYRYMASRNSSPPSAASADVNIASSVGEQIQTVVRAKSGQIKYCYEKALKEHPTAAGRIVVDLTISAGAVTAVDVAENTTGIADVASCAVSKIEMWQFPAEVSEMVTLPFALSPG